MQLVTDFLTLRFFVTPYVMVLVYWLGAFVAPLLAALFTAWIVSLLRQNDTSAAGIEKVSGWWNQWAYARHAKMVAILVFATIFLFLELVWRMLFEFLIALFHIHDALLTIANKT